MLNSTISIVSLLSFFIIITGGLSIKFDWNHSCRGVRPGDCDPTTCGGPCEARYIRFYDRAIQGDRTAKSCQCSEERICSLIGMNAYSGCRSYASLSTAAQRAIRIWSMDYKDRINKNSNDIMKRYSDKNRHQQLMNGHSRFCCRARSPLRANALYLRSSARITTTVTPMLESVFILILLRFL